MDHRCLYEQKKKREKTSTWCDLKLYTTIFFRVCKMYASEWIGWNRKQIKVVHDMKVLKPRTSVHKINRLQRRSSKNKKNNEHIQHTLNNWKLLFHKESGISTWMFIFPFAAFYRVCLNGKSTFILFNIIEFSAFFQPTKKSEWLKKKHKAHWENS